MTDRYGADVLAGDWRVPKRGRAVEAPAELGAVVEEVTTDWVGEIVAVDRDPKRVALGAERASMLGLHDAVRYRRSTIEELGPWRDAYLGLFPLASEGGAARSSPARFSLARAPALPPSSFFFSLARG